MTTTLRRHRKRPAAAAAMMPSASEIVDLSNDTSISPVRQEARVTTRYSKRGRDHGQNIPENPNGKVGMDSIAIDHMALAKKPRERPNHTISNQQIGSVQSSNFKKEMVLINEDEERDQEVQLIRVEEGDQDVQLIRVEEGGQDVQLVKVEETIPAKPEIRILSIFPDVDLAHVKTLLDQLQGDIQEVINHLVENDYPKTLPIKPLVLVNKKKVDWKFDYTSVQAFKPLPDYIEEATKKLQYDFHFLTLAGLKKIMAQYNSRYSICHEKIVTAIIAGAFSTDEDHESIRFARYENACFGIVLTTNQTTALVQLSKVKKPQQCVRRHFNVSHAANPLPPQITNEVLQDEINYVQHKIKLWEADVKNRREQSRNKAVAGLTGTGVECSCCFVEYLIEDMVQCREAHLFCPECLKTYAETQIFSQGNLGIDKVTKQPALELKCCYSGNDVDCVSGFDRASLEKALSTKTLEKYDELQFQMSIRKAKFDDLCSCPKCGFQAALSLEAKVFACPVDDCLFESCRECGEAAHIPLRCEEAKEKSDIKGRVTVEEAINAAKVRQCPQCHKAFVKSDGCNKVRCGCGVYVCYVCRQQISGYDHFCQVPHCTHQSCKKCSLWTKCETEDANAMREAGLKAAAQVEAAAQLEAAALGRAASNSGLKIDVDSILKGVPKVA